MLNTLTSFGPCSDNALSDRHAQPSDVLNLGSNCMANISLRAEYVKDCLCFDYHIAIQCGPRGSTTLEIYLVWTSMATL